VEELRPLVPEGWSLAQFALRWILMHDAVSTVIPGGKTPRQVEDNSRASGLPALSLETMRAVERVYAHRISPYVHHRW
jgi:aryl-alcohol dehydrogenase-like predicted oxidoreductase